MEGGKEIHRGDRSDEKPTKHDVAGADEDNIEVIGTRELKDPGWKKDLSVSGGCWS